MQSEMSSSQIANSSTQDVTVHSAATSMMDGIHKDGAGDSYVIKADFISLSIPEF